MKAVNGTLKQISQTKKGDYILKGEWEDGRDAQFVSPKEFQKLLDHGYARADGTWPDGNPKYAVVDAPRSVPLVVHLAKGKKPWTSIELDTNGTTPKAAPKAAQEKAVVPTENRELFQQARNTYAACMAMVRQIWVVEAEREPDDAALQAGTFSLFKWLTERGAMLPAGKLPEPEKPKGGQQTSSDFDDVPPEFEDGESDSLPF